MPIMIRSRLLARIFFLYVSVVISGIAIITLHNLYTNRLPLKDFFQNYFFIKLMIGVLCVVLFQFYTRWRLRHVSRYFDGQGGERERHAAWRSLLAFPSEIFWMMIGYGLLISPSYHLLNAAEEDLSDLSLQEDRYLLENLLFDQALSLTLAVAFYTGLSRIARSYILQLSGDFPMTRNSSVIRFLLVTFTALYLVSVFSMLWYTVNSIAAGQDVKLPVLGGIGAACLLFASWVFARGVLDYRDQFRVLVLRIRQILQQKHGLEHERIPIVSADETGRLAAAINRLQQHIEAEFEGVQRELDLARQVQLRLLPGTDLNKGPLKIAAALRLSKDVGGDFYDFIDMDDSRTAIVIGDVSGKGMQAALIMSATIVLLRSEIRRGGGASHIMTRLNRQLSGTLGASSCVTLFILIIDRSSLQTDYASAGHLSPYLLRSGALEELDCPSLPLGIDPDVIYRGAQFQLQKGDRIVLLTDGVVEAEMPDGGMLGFESFERILRQVPEASRPQEALGSLIARLPWESGAKHEDDRTLVFLQV
jgi:serine phosphatase RsbU (regulator of sigma subunit)